MKKRTVLIVIFFTILQSNMLYGYDDKITHPEITRKAVSDVSKLDIYLKTALGFWSGLDEQLPSNSTDPNRTTLKLLTSGSTLEDSPMCRASNHFHNPLLSWNQSQLNDSSGVTGWAIHGWCVSKGWLDENRKSAITWATGYQTYDGPIVPRTNQDMGWDNTRSYFYSALTSTINTDRDAILAKTFQALGQVIHLLEDMAVPAHVRNDFLNSHVYTGGANPYELYVKLHPELVSGLTDSQILIPAFTNPRPTDFWDTTRQGMGTLMHLVQNS